MRHPDRTVVVLLSAVFISIGAVYFQVQNIRQSEYEVDKKRSEYQSGKASVIAGIDDSKYLAINYSVYKNIPVSYTHLTLPTKA